MSFESDVVYYGDGQGMDNRLQSKSLDDYNALLEMGKVFGSDLLLRSISESLT